MSRGWNMYRDIRAVRFLVCRWIPDIHTFFFAWGETTITLEEVERTCLLPSMGDANLLELGLSDEESMIARKLLETFGGLLCLRQVIEPSSPFGFLSLENLKMLM